MIDLLENMPQKPLNPTPKQEIDRDYLLAEAYLLKKDCPKAKLYLDSVKSLTKNRFIFQPNRTIPSNMDKGQVQYDLTCNPS